MRIIAIIAFLLAGCRCNPTPTHHDAALDGAILIIDGAQPPDGPTHVHGAFSLSVMTGLAANCAPDGAKIDVMQLTFRDGTDVCVPTTLQIREFGDFAVRCDGQINTIPCIDPDMLIIGSNLPLGGYHLGIAGLRNGVDCWDGDASIGVLEGTPSEQSLTLLFQARCSP